MVLPRGLSVRIPQSRGLLENLQRTAIQRLGPGMLRSYFLCQTVKFFKLVQELRRRENRHPIDLTKHEQMRIA